MAKGGLAPAPEPGLKRLQEILRSMGRAVVAFSGGVDSTFLLAVAREVLAKDSLLAVTATSLTFPEREVAEAERLAALLDVEHLLVRTEEMNIPEFRSNPVDRCYVCKRELLSRIKGIAECRGFPWVLEGSTVDDRQDHRPGRKAVKELHVRSPLEEAGLGKESIRLLSRRMNLPTWNRPPFACLASRFPYGEPIDEERLKMVDRAEQVLFDLGFRGVRVRICGDTARIETSISDIARFLEAATRDLVAQELKRLGFIYVALDLEGYRPGRMNEALGRERRGDSR